MQVATKSQVKRLVQKGDQQMAIKGAMAAQSVYDLMQGWGEMQQWEVDNAAGQLRSLLEFIEGDK